MRYLAPVSEDQPASKPPLQHHEATKYDESVKREPQELKESSQAAPIKPMDLFMQARSSNIQPQSIMTQAENIALFHHKVDEEVSLKRTQTEYKEPRYHEPEQAQHQRNSAKPVTQSYSHYDRNEADSFNQKHSENPFIEGGGRTDHRSSSYSLEADQYLNQIVTILAHFRSLGKRSADSVTQLEAQLSIEKDNCNQQKSLLDLERQAKAMVQEELQSTRDVISQLTDKYDIGYLHLLNF